MQASIAVRTIVLIATRIAQLAMGVVRPVAWACISTCSRWETKLDFETVEISKFPTAQSRLCRRHSWGSNAHWKALDEIQQIDILLHFSKLTDLESFRQGFGPNVKFSPL